MPLPNSSARNVDWFRYGVSKTCDYLFKDMKSMKLSSTSVLQPRMSNYALADPQKGLQFCFEEEELAANMVDKNLRTRLHRPQIILW